MFDYRNKKDEALIDAVKGVMKTSETDRKAIAHVNEKFGIQARNELPHERHADYDRTVAEVQQAARSGTLTEGRLDEISDEAKRKYTKAASADVKKISAERQPYDSKSLKKINNRLKGIRLAKEDTEQLDEIKKILDPYIKGASADVIRRTKEPYDKKKAKKIDSRLGYIDKAVRKASGKAPIKEGVGPWSNRKAPTGSIMPKGKGGKVGSPLGAAGLLKASKEFEERLAKEKAKKGLKEAEQLTEISKRLAASYYNKSRKNELKRAQEIPMTKWNNDKQMANRGKGQTLALQKLKKSGIKGLKVKGKARVAANEETTLASIQEEIRLHLISRLSAIENNKVLEEEFFASLSPEQRDIMGIEEQQITKDNFVPAPPPGMAPAAPNSAVQQPMLAAPGKVTAPSVPANAPAGTPPIRSLMPQPAAAPTTISAAKPATKPTVNAAKPAKPTMKPAAGAK